MASSNASWSLLPTPASNSDPETDVEQMGDSVPMAVDGKAEVSSARQSPDSDVEMQQEWVQSVRAEIEAINRNPASSAAELQRRAQK